MDPKPASGPLANIGIDGNLLLSFVWCVFFFQICCQNYPHMPKKNKLKDVQFVFSPLETNFCPFKQTLLI